MLKKIFDPTLFRFLLVGVVNTLVGYGVMFGLYNLAGLHLWGDPGYWISSAANYLVGSVVSFFLNKHFTFRSREKGPGVVLRFAARPPSVLRRRDIGCPCAFCIVRRAFVRPVRQTEGNEHPARR